MLRLGARDLEGLVIDVFGISFMHWCGDYPVGG